MKGPPRILDLLRPKQPSVLSKDLLEAGLVESEEDIPRQGGGVRHSLKPAVRLRRQARCIEVSSKRPLCLQDKVPRGVVGDDFRETSPKYLLNIHHGRPTLHVLCDEAVARLEPREVRGHAGLWAVKLDL